MPEPHPLNPHGLPIVLVLQGGGALGAYQAGVLHALDEHGLVPEWITGTSIGAINAALIAGNPPECRLARLKTFWERIAHPDWLDMARVSDAERRLVSWTNCLDAIWRGVPGFFTPRLASPFPLGCPVAPGMASFYDTAPLLATLQELVDFDYLNAPGGVRLTVNAVNVETGQLAHFDNRSLTLEPAHICASGSLPPGFPPVRVGDQWYWDGGLYSNTPLETVLEHLPGEDTLCFMVDLWCGCGPLPTSLDQVHSRQKDVMYASRSHRHIEDYVRTHAMQHKLRELYARLPPGSRSAADEQELAALGTDSTLHIVRLSYGGSDWQMAAKDVNFSHGSLNWRWDQGYADALRAIGKAGWLVAVEEDTAVVVHDLPD
jgi:NTE family protein